MPASAIGLRTKRYGPCTTSSRAVASGSGVPRSRVAMTQAALGAKVEVSTLGGELTVDASRTDDSGTETLSYRAQVPARFNLELAFDARDDLLLAAGLSTKAAEALALIWKITRISNSLSALRLRKRFTLL